MKKALVLGGGGFIGGHLINKLKESNFWVRGVDLKENPWGNNGADDFQIADLRDRNKVTLAFGVENFDWVFQLAADMGGAGYINTGDNDADVMHNSCMINLNVLDVISKLKIKPKVLYSSTACVYNEHNQLNPLNPICTEGSEYPAFPDTEYGWEKLFSERLYQTYGRLHDIDYKIVRFHNIYGEQGSWSDGKEKAPAALCRKVAECKEGGVVEIWGDGNQTRSFLHVSEAVEGLMRMMDSEFRGPVNLGSDKLISINDFVDLISKISGKKVIKKNIDGPEGVRGRNSDNNLIFKKLGWKPDTDLVTGVSKTYSWILKQVKLKNYEQG